MDAGFQRRGKAGEPLPGVSRRTREQRTIAAMVGIYCRDLHAPGRGLCGACEELLAYAGQRLDRCLFKDDKPVCAECPVHCYKPAMRSQVREVMRYAGPRMTFRHPILALRHLLEGRRKRDLSRGPRPAATPVCAAAPDSAGPGDPPAPDTAAPAGPARRN
jgi:hypothetical protein